MLSRNRKNPKACKKHLRQFSRVPAIHNKSKKSRNWPPLFCGSTWVDIFLPISQVDFRWLIKSSAWQVVRLVQASYCGLSAAGLQRRSATNPDGLGPAGTGLDDGSGPGASLFWRALECFACAAWVNLPPSEQPPNKTPLTHPNMWPKPEYRGLLRV